MQTSVIRQALDRLLKEGQDLTSKDWPAKPTDAGQPSAQRTDVQRQFRLWRAKVGDTLRLAVDEKSEIIKSFDKVNAGDEGSPDQVRDICDLISRAIDLHSLRPLVRADLNPEVEIAVNEVFQRSGAYQLCRYALIGAFFFALVGGIGLTVQGLSVSKVFKDAETQVLVKLEEVAKTETKRIEDATKERIKKIEEGKPQFLVQLTPAELKWLKIGLGVFAVFSVAAFGTSIFVLRKFRR